MKKLTTMMLLAAFLLVAAPSAFAQGGEKVAGGPNWVAIVAGFGMAIAAAFCGLAQSRVGAAACEGMARNPGAADNIRAAMTLSLIFIESLVLFTFGMIYLKAV